MKKSKKHLGKWWRMSLLLFVCLFGGSSGAYAMRIITNDYYTDWGYMSSINNQPTANDLYIGIDLVYYEGEGNDTYFTHSKGDGSHDGPALYVDGKYICSPDNELGWKGNYKAAESACGDDDWWGNTYTKDGIVVKFWNPYHMTDHYWVNRVQMRIYLPDWKVGESHTVKLKGYWMQDTGTEKLVEKSWTTNAFPDVFPAASPTAVMTNYNTVSVSGQLNGSLQMSVGLAPNLTAAPSGYMTIGSPNSIDYNKKTSFSGFTTTLSWGNDYTASRKLPIQYSTIRSSDVGDKYVYKWYEVNVPGFAYANISDNVTTDMWNKKVTLSWTAVDGNNRCKKGKWKIKNLTTGELFPAGDTKIDYGSNTRTYTITVPKYDTNYNIGVYFVPDGMTSLNNTLCITKQVRISRSFAFSNLNASNNLNNGIRVSWSHTTFGDASSSKRYTISLQRTENANDSTSWQTIKDFYIENPTTSSGDYMDTGLQAQTTYFYRLRVAALDNVTYTSGTMSGSLNGMTTVTELKASQGLYNNMVKLNWKVDQRGTNTTYFTVSRRLFGSKKETDWAELATLSGVGASYSYDDMTVQLGMFYEYRVATSIIQNVAGKDTVKLGMMITTDGFAMSTGTVSGHITYGTGTAVPGAKVVLQSNEVGFSGLRSLELEGSGTNVGLLTNLTPATIQELFENDFSIQMYINPDSSKMKTDELRYILLDVPEVFHIGLDYEASTGRYKLGAWIAERGYTDLYIPACQWSHVTLVHKHNPGTTTFYVAAADTLRSAQVGTGGASPQVWTDRPIVWSSSAMSASTIGLGNYGSQRSNQGNNFQGHIDEFRFFTDTLSVEDIKNNYNHPLVGNEKGLAIYYPFDEGMESQTKVYDFSKTNGVMNCRFAQANVAAKSSDNISEELGMFSYTDKQGNYTVRGVSFAGDGTSYLVTPELGIHEFSPAYKTVYVSGNSLVHSGVDFEDISAFPVSGNIYYAGTDYPVEGVNFYVDGTICSKDGKMVTTDETGAFTISVPIGDHFITVEKQGHVFANGGRYPADPGDVGTRHTFDQEIKTLTFTDETLVNFAGRVVGGNIEGDKTIGFGLSNNNIGVTELVLTPQNPDPRINVVKVVEGNTYKYVPNTETVAVASAGSRVNSTAWRGEGENCRKIIIRTDPATGEFSAMVPPLQYQIGAMKVVKTGLEVGALTVVDLTDPRISYTDTLYDASGAVADVFTYNTLLRQTYHSTPTFNVVQDGHKDGAFGLSSYNLLDEEGELTINDIYTLDANGKPVYKYGGAVFEMDERYKFDIEAFEEYENSDGATAVTDHVPLANLVVTIDNALSNEQAVYVEDGTVDGNAVTAGQVVELQANQLQLDSLGCATYTWKAGLPNISSPYTRTIGISYEINGRHYQWDNSGMAGIILGSMPTGNNFVTAGPDMLDMILRDPPGTGSSAEWSSGKVISKTKTKMGTWSSENHVTTKSKLGADIKTITGTPGFGKIDNLEADNDLELGILINVEGEAGDSWSRTVETTKTIATSDAMEYVGAQGDVFVGTATNIIFGKARNIDFHRIGSSSEVELNLSDVLTTGMSFGTEFAYTQNYIENVLIPNLEALRNSMLITVSDVNGHTCDREYPIYLTTRAPGDEGYGENNPPKVVKLGKYEYKEPSSDGPSYKMVVPIESENYQDSVMWCNTQIAAWKRYLALNEEQKVRAFEQRNNKDSVDYKNLSFDSGSSVTNNVEIEETKGYKYDVQVASGIHLNNTWGILISGTGVIFDAGTETTAGYHTEDENSTSQKTSFSYTLKEEGDNDALTVDVYQYGAYGPIFRTRGGQTSAPYEGKEVTKYYEPGTTIMDATMKIEVPQIDVDMPVISDIPTGAAANYTLRLGNESETGDDVAYKLFVLDETNPYGAQLSVDGKVLTEGRLIKVPGNQTLTKTLQLRQTDASVLEYEGNMEASHDLYKKGIGIVFASESQPEDIADTIFIKAYYVPSSSDVQLALSNSTMNTQTGTDLQLTFSGFDRNYHNLKAFRLQYKKQGSTDWTQLKEYVLKEADKTSNNILLPATGTTVSYTLPMAAYSDGDYLFRVASVATYGNDEVYKYSDELALVKDTKRPTPMGLPEPSDGVLDIGDEMSVTFNEDILKGELTKEANIRVTGVLNGAEVAHETALSIGGASVAATTEAGINLANKDFSIDSWVNITASGTLLSHGQGSNKLTVGTNAAGKLVVDIAGQTYTSTNSAPTGKWAFLTLNYQTTENGGNLSASVASANETVELFANEAVATYVGNGPLSVGCGSTAAMHELLLWDEARDITTALADRSVTKKPSTRHLIGYWKMNEGEGTTIRDYARNRNMTMPAETWYLNNVNKAVTFNGQNYMSFVTDQLPISNDDDYALEFWMRGEQQTGETQLLQMGDVALGFDADGKLSFTGKGAYLPADQQTSSLKPQTSNLLDNLWHHVALNVMRQGVATVYVDGQRCLTTSPDNVGSIATNNLIVGAHRTIPSTEGGFYTYDHPFKGEIDEIRVWNATMNSDQIAKNRKVRFTGKEDGLVVYLPFETKTLDSYNQVITIGTPNDLTGSGLQAQFNALGGSPAEIAYTDAAPALRTKPVETNVSFTYTASSDKIVIDLDEDPATVEGCTLNFTVCSVRDENGNYSVPAVWSAFVNRNELVWADDALSLEQQVKSQSTLTATIVNKGGKQQMWTLEGMPSWLSASTDFGTTNARSETAVTFTVSPATPIGKYEETVYLKGNDGIETPLTINVKVTGKVPDWAVNPKDFENSMNVIGRVEIEGTPMDDEDDLVAAFIGEECRGVAHPVYKERYDGSFITMDIYGNNETGQQVTFRAYDASTGTLYPVVTPDPSITFAPLSLIGKYDKPVVLTVEDLIEQQTELKAGWNWLSLSVKPADMTVPAIFEKIADNVVNVKSQHNGYLTYENNSWGGGLMSALSNTQMYAVQMKADSKLRVVGQRVDPASAVITAGEGWNWIGYYGRQVASVSDAFAGLQPTDGDILKGQSGVSYFDTYEWAGSLPMMEPGIGYMLKSVTTNDRQFSYPESTVAAARTMINDLADVANADNYSAFSPVNYRKYANNAIMAVRVMADGKALGNIEIGVFADDECRTAALTNDEGVAYLTIPGDEEATLTFKVALGDQIIDAATTVNYEVDGVYGSPKHPMVIDLGEANGIREMLYDSGIESIYDLSGRKITLDDNSRKLHKGVYIINGRKKTVK